MNNMAQFFSRNLDVVFFVYGIAFVTMGIAILAHNKRDSGYGIAGILWLLAGFGMTHGLNELLDMWTIIKGRMQVFDIIRLACLVISFIFLFEFGRRLFGMTGDSLTRFPMS